MKRRAKPDATTVARIRGGVSFPALVKDKVALIRDTKTRFVALCPFHAEDTPSFIVCADHGHCFGCGWHGNSITWLMERERMSFTGALRHLCSIAGASEPEGIALDAAPQDNGWRPLLPVPPEAPALLHNGYTSRIYNPKRKGEPGEWKTWRPTLVHPYRDADGCLRGYVLRCEYVKDGKRHKFTPTITYCMNDDGENRWCLIPFTRPRSLYGLDLLAARPAETVLLVEGEKTADAARRLLPSFVAVTWAGGSKSYQHTDWSPLAGRKVVCVPDADDEGRIAFSGRAGRGRHVPGILAILSGVGARVRCVATPASLPDGWDLADAEAEGWDSARTLAWIKSNLAEVRDAA